MKVGHLTNIPFGADEGDNGPRGISLLAWNTKH